jgi:hypothetical protein
LSELLSRFRNLITSASEQEIRADVTLGRRLLIDEAGPITISYAPSEHIQRGARVVFVGITPGAQQAANALIEARRRLLAGDDDHRTLATAKMFASFSGPMRSNLIAMLDHIGLSRWLGISGTALLWDEHGALAHFTSALCFPALVDGKNYSGQPSLVTTPILRRLVDRHLCEEAEALRDAVWIPLGPKAADAVRLLVQKDVLGSSMVLDGLPHPSGANAERIAYFLGRKSRSALSSKTGPDGLDSARERLLAKVATLPRHGT